MSSYSILKLVPEVALIESHLLWMESAFPKYYMVTQNPNIHKINLVHKSLERCNNEYLKDLNELKSPIDYHVDDDLQFTEECHYHSPKYINVFAKVINKCAKVLYIGKTEIASELLKELYEILDKVESKQRELTNVLEYFIRALEWPIHTLLHKWQDGEKDENLRLLRCKWEGLQKNKKCRAVIAYLKTTLQTEIRSLGSGWILSTLAQVICLDPNYHIWYHHLYHATRNARKSFNHGIEAPSEREIELCQRAFKLAPNLMISNFDMGLLHKDMLWMATFRPKTLCIMPEDSFKEYHKCLHFFELAISFAEEHGLKNWSLKIKVEKAEVLLNVKNNLESRETGLNILLNFLKEFPENAVLHQKLAKLYHHGVVYENSNWLKDIDKAREHYQRALELRDYFFFSCLEDYVKMLKDHPHPLQTKKFLEIFNKCGAAEKKRHFIERMNKVRVWRAFIVWIYNPTNLKDHKKLAVEEWLLAIREREYIFSMIKAPPFVIYSEANGQTCRNNAEIDLQELQVELSKIKSDVNTDPVIVINAELFLKEINKLQGFASLRQYLQSELSLSSHNLKQGKKSNAPKQRNRSAADDDDNWRVRK